MDLIAPGLARGLSPTSSARSPGLSPEAVRGWRCGRDSACQALAVDTAHTTSVKQSGIVALCRQPIAISRKTKSDLTSTASVWVRRRYCHRERPLVRARRSYDLAERVWFEAVIQPRRGGKPKGSRSSEAGATRRATMRSSEMCASTTPADRSSIDRT